MLNKAPYTLTEDQQTALTDYLINLFAARYEGDVHRQISETTTEHGLRQIDVRADEGFFLMWLAKLINAKKILEIGTLAGYSGVWLAKGLPDAGKLITLELEQKNAEVARRNFEAAGVSDKIEIKVGNAHETLKTLDDTFDFVFIDAEKEGYDAYLTWALDHVRVGGIIAGHNAIRRGDVANPNSTDDFTINVRAFNERMAKESRLLSFLFPAGDGTVVGIVQKPSP